MSDLELRRKLTFRSGGRKIVLWKKANERGEHVLMKAFLWSMYLPEYDDLLVEYKIADRYKPDVVSLAPDGVPRFWGEAGKVGTEKLAALIRRYPTTHFAMAKWSTRLEPYREIVEKILRDHRLQAPFDLINFPADAGDRFVSDNGAISVRRSEIELIRFEPGD